MSKLVPYTITPFKKPFKLLYPRRMKKVLASYSREEKKTGKTKKPLSRNCVGINYILNLLFRREKERTFIASVYGVCWLSKYSRALLNVNTISFFWNRFKYIFLVLPLLPPWLLMQSVCWKKRLQSRQQHLRINNMQQKSIFLSFFWRMFCFAKLVFFLGGKHVEYSVDCAQSEI